MNPEEGWYRALVRDDVDTFKTHVNIENAGTLTRNNLTPFNISISTNRWKCFNYMLDECAPDVNEFFDFNSGDHIETPLSLAVACKRTEFASKLLDAGADVNARIKFGWRQCSIMHITGYNRATACAALLLRHKADINALDDHGATPLDWAASSMAELNGYTVEFQKQMVLWGGQCVKKSPTYLCSEARLVRSQLAACKVAVECVKCVLRRKRGLNRDVIGVIAGMVWESRGREEWSVFSPTRGKKQKN